MIYMSLKLRHLRVLSDYFMFLKEMVSPQISDDTLKVDCLFQFLTSTV
jgi:hypothetical protein